ncbi:hypothetical protein ACPPVO_21550 [Dactylosporangium sp. McL0621]|uniref:hypothetical protein n=1 Tax=Dactylosporangium sp. McL0621 TaxID=3415678 RepID=UPI003CE6EDA6
MGTGAAVISAIAASIAAILTAVNLYITGRRDHTKWAREALVEVMVTFVDASFEGKDAVKYGIRDGKPNAWPPAPDAQCRIDAQAAKSQMRTMQSRLRLLSTPEILDAAQILREANAEYVKLLDEDHAVAVEQDAYMRNKLWMLRQDFINEAKRALTLPRAWRRTPNTKPSEAIGPGSS